MSKKTRKKSPKKSSKTPADSAARKAARAPAAKSSKTPATKTGLAKASKTAKKTVKKPAKAAKKAVAKAVKPASQKPPSKPLKSASAKAPAPSKVATLGMEAGDPSVDNAPQAQPVAPAVRAAGLTEGAKAPAFHLPRDGGGSVSLSDYAGKKLVLFFYPRADTPGCTKEAIDFTRLSGAFAESQTAVLGVSADPPKAQEAFRDKHQLATPLVSDEAHQMLEAYGVWGEKSMYGRTFQGILRTTVVIGADGLVLKIWRNVKVDGHADEVLATVRTL
jgi:thioredoxin-dependent peroxiredoxin